MQPKHLYTYFMNVTMLNVYGRANLVQCFQNNLILPTLKPQATILGIIEIRCPWNSTPLRGQFPPGEFPPSRFKLGLAKLQGGNLIGGN